MEALSLWCGRAQSFHPVVLRQNPRSWEGGSGVAAPASGAPQASPSSVLGCREDPQPAQLGGGPRASQGESEQHLFGSLASAPAHAVWLGGAPLCPGLGASATRCPLSQSPCSVTDVRRWHLLQAECPGGGAGRRPEAGARLSPGPAPPSVLPEALWERPARGQAAPRARGIWSFARRFPWDGWPGKHRCEPRREAAVGPGPPAPGPSAITGPAGAAHTEQPRSRASVEQ